MWSRPQTTRTPRRAAAAMVPGMCPASRAHEIFENLLRKTMSPEEESTEARLNHLLAKLLSEAEDKAVNEEGQRCAEAIRTAIHEAQNHGFYASEQILRKCLAAIVTPSEPRPQTPMTDARFIQNLMDAWEKGTPDWIAVEKDLGALINARPGWDDAVRKNQARRDAEIAARGAYIGGDTGRWIATEILRTVGLSSAAPASAPGRSPSPTGSSPMTIAAVIEKWHPYPTKAPAFEADLHTLIGQAIRQDANLCCYGCQQTILKQAGLQ